MAEERKVRDPVHGFIRLKRKEAEIVDTALFQRLRRIRQLALASLVYPGAVHTRFEHSLGVCHISGSLAKIIGLNQEDVDLVRLGALVHDLGHGPFSHVSESALEIYVNRGKIGDRLKSTETMHELITEDLIREDPELCTLIGKSECDKIAKLLSRGYGEPALKSIVSGPLDADKQDYLLRDSYHCGVKYGVFDLQQLQSELQAVEDPADGSKQLMISKDGVHALEQFALAKYHLTAQVYRHKVRLITDQMLIRAIRLGIDVDEIEELQKLYAYDASPEFLKNYVAWDDERFLQAFGRDDRYGGKQSHDILRRLRERKLFKRIYSERLSSFPQEVRDRLNRISEPGSRREREELEKKLTEVIKQHADQEADRHFVIVHAYNIKFVRGPSEKDEGQILVQAPYEDPKPFEDESELFKSMRDRMADPFIEVYAPVSYDTPQERRELLKKLSDPVTETLTAHFGERGESDGSS